MTLKVKIDRLLQITALSLFFVMGWTLMSMAAPDNDSTKNKIFQIQRLEWENNDSTLRIQGDSPPVFTVYDLFNPARIVIDIADGVLPESLTLPPDSNAGPISQIKGNILTDQVPQIAQLQLILNKDGKYDYKIVREQNDIIVQFSPKKKEEADQVKEKIVIQSISVEKLPLETRLHIKSASPVTDYTTLNLEKDMGHMPRVCLDLPGVETKKIDLQIEDSPLINVSSEMLAQADGIRIIMESAQESIFLYDIEATENGLDIIITDPESDIPEPAAALAATGLINDDNKAKTEQTEKQGAEKPIIQPIAVKKEIDESPVPSPADVGFDKLSFAGYTAQKISVDFYKIDLHNVFRLIGDISQKNIVVDEAVNGSLTLTLNDVPWDFALDIILNLKDLQKEERFNTIVISPKDKSFNWPENTASNLEIEVDTDPLKVEKRLEVNQETFAAKKLIRHARDLEKAKNYKDAVVLYEKALTFWPNNSDLAERTASIYLVHLGLNAKAAFFARKAQDLDHENIKAALTAAIALANLEKVQEAQEYFEIAVNTPIPSKQALASYAAFCEQNNNFSAAINLLDRFEKSYGSSLQIMISKARILDKLGNKELAIREYRAALNSGEDLPESLKIYINKRLAD